MTPLGQAEPQVATTKFMHCSIALVLQSPRGLKTACATTLPAANFLITAYDSRTFTLNHRNGRQHYLSAVSVDLQCVRVGF